MPIDILTNRLPSGVTEAQVREAIDASGYPLQLRVAATLTDAFMVTEEASYIDRITGELRTIDLSAYLQLHENPASERLKVYPGLELLIECKHSELPYIFFRAATKPPLIDFPQVHGLRGRDVELYCGTTHTKCSVPMALGLPDESFVASGPPTCATFSKVVRKGPTLELSGAEPFQKVVMPLLSAVDASMKRHEHRDDHDFYSPLLVLAVCVVDAPMVLVDVLNDRIEMQPWVRIVRHESTAARRDVWGRTGFYAVDVVHADFFRTFIEEHVSSLAVTFRQRIERRHALLHRMKGYLRDFSSWTWRDIEDPGAA